MTSTRYEMQEPAKFNMALATLERMNDLMRSSTTVAVGEDIDYLLLFRIESELWQEVKPYATKKQTGEKKSKLGKKFEEILKSYKIILGENKQNINSRYLTTNKEEFANLVKGLSEIRPELREVMNDLGLLMPRSDDPRFAAYM